MKPIPGADVAIAGGQLTDPIWYEWLKQLQTSTTKFGANVIDITKSPYNCLADGVTDNAVGLQKAMNDAQAAGVPFYIPGAKVIGGASGHYRYSQTLNSDASCAIIGDGMENSFLEFTGTGPGLLIQPAAPTYGLTTEYPTVGRLSDFTIRPSVALAGTYGIQVKLGAGRTYGNFNWTNVRSAQWGITSVYLDNSVANVDGFFVGLMTNCQFGNGFTAAGIGDSIDFRMVRISGNAPISITGIGGARELVFYNCSLTNLGGFQTSDVAGVRLLYSHLEAYGAFTGSTGLVTLNNCYQGSIIGNRIAAIGPGAKPQWNTALLGTSRNVIIDQNEVEKGTVGHFYGGASTTRVRVRDGNDNGGVAWVNSLLGTASVDASY